MVSIELYSFSIKTSKREEFVLITESVKDYIKKSKITLGSCKVYIPHTTAGITINENSDPDVTNDIIKTLSALVPHSKMHLHSEGNSDAHVKSSMIGCNIEIPIYRHELILGQWQGIYFCEFDGPRTRKIYVQIIGE